MLINSINVNPLNLAFKGVYKDLSTNCGRKVDGTSGFLYNKPLGEWYETELEEETVTCHHYGFHCARNPLDCYYSYGRTFLVEVGGDWDEEDDMLCSTKIRFIKELDVISFVAYAIKFITLHPYMPDSYKVSSEEKIRVKDPMKFYETEEEKSFIIVRGKNPQVMAPKGTVVGLLKEKPDSPQIEFATIFIVGKDGVKPNKYYSVKDFV